MCKIDVTYCGGPDQAEHVEMMVLGLQEAADDSDDNEFQPYDDEEYPNLSAQLRLAHTAD